MSFVTLRRGENVIVVRPVKSTQAKPTCGERVCQAFRHNLNTRFTTAAYTTGAFLREQEGR